MNTVFPFSSNPSIASSNISEENFPPPTKVKKRPKVARAEVKEKKVLTRSMERLVLGLQVLFIVMYALFVRYDSEQGDPLQSTKVEKAENFMEQFISKHFNYQIQKTRFSQLFPDGVGGTPAVNVISEGVVPAQRTLLAPNYVEYYGPPRPLPPFYPPTPPLFARNTADEEDTRSVLREWLKEQEARSKQTLLKYDSCKLKLFILQNWE
jgi:hypothetical protein